MTLLDSEAVRQYENLVKESYPFVRETKPAQLETLINNALSLGEWELARIACRALFTLQPQTVLHKLKKLAIEGVPTGWYASAGLPTAYHLAWLAAGEYEELSRQKVLIIIKRDSAHMPRAPQQRKGHRFLSSYLMGFIFILCCTICSVMKVLSRYATSPNYAYIFILFSPPCRARQRAAQSRKSCENCMLRRTLSTAASLLCLLFRPSRVPPASSSL